MQQLFWQVPMYRLHLQTELTFGWARKDEATASEAGCSGQVLQVLCCPSPTSYLLLSLAQHLSVIYNLTECQCPPQLCTTGWCPLIDKDSYIISPLLLFVRYVILAGNS